MKQYFMKAALLIAGTFSVVIGAQAEEAAKAFNALNVELLVFSGRPNPTFVITDQNEIRKIMGLAKSLPQNKDVKEGESGLPESKLGYQGFIVTNTTLTSPEIKSFVVHGSAVQLALAPASNDAKAAGKAGVEQAARIDSTTSLESNLLSHVKTQGIVDDKLLEFIDNSK